MDTKTFKWLLGLLAPLWRWVAAAVFFGFLTIGSSIALMGTSAWLIARAALHPSVAELSVAIVGVRFFGISRGLFRYLERLTSHEVTFRLLRNLRVWFYETIEPLAPARLTYQRSGDLLARVMGDIETLENFYIRAVAPPVVAVLIMLVMVVFTGALHPLLALVLLAAVLLVGVLLPYAAWRSGQQPGAEMVIMRAELNSALLDGIQGMAELLVFGQEQRQMERVQRLNRQLADSQRTMAFQNGWQTAAGALGVSLTVITMLVIGIPRLDSIMLAPLALAVTACFEAFLPLSSAFQVTGSNLEAGRRLVEMTTPDKVQNSGVKKEHDSYTIEFDRVTFRYQPDHPPVLTHFSLTIPHGEQVAITGESGIGKTTLVNLLLRFWEVEQGEIRLGGVSLRDYDPEALRRLIGVVSQQPHIFNATIRENLLLARPDADENALVKAARQARIHDFIVSLPEGYDTWVGEQGYKLSGGERQRLAIARVLLKDAPILLLDEPTANLDAENARLILQAVAHASEGRTTLLITHQPELIQGQFFVQAFSDFLR
ncbi:MAG: thiol reductant ABC exporter subunit CydC [Anaerolineae bacterium]|nr:thiol reductant ABC exporter subunit CydC [Anaerolineae bacterium]